MQCWCACGDNLFFSVQANLSLCIVSLSDICSTFHRLARLSCGLFQHIYCAYEWSVAMQLICDRLKSTDFLFALYT